MEQIPTLFKIVRNDTFGRYLVASHDICAGDIIFVEDPIMLGPKRFSSPICLGCHQGVDGSYFCSKCGFPMCSSHCQNISIHADNECLIFGAKGSRPKKFADYKAPQPLYQCILPLRLLSLRYTDPTKWEKLSKMEHHTEARKKASAEDWHMNHVNIVQFLRNWCCMQDFDEETIHRIIGIIDVNCFHVKTVDKIEMSGIYENGSIPCQDCVPNTHHAFTQNGVLIFRASIPISAGQMLTMSYAPVLTGTLERRQLLRKTKYFDCICKRCADPTEEGTFISALKCLHCQDGYLLPEFPLQEDSAWVCYTGVPETKCGIRNANCLNSIPIDKVVSTVEEIRRVVLEGVQSDSLGLEKLTKSYSGVFLHPNHFLLIPVLQKLNQLYNANNSQNPENETSKNNEAVTQKLLHILERLQPGLTRARGVLLYEMCLAQHRAAKCQLESQEISQEAYETLRKNLQNSLKYTEKIFELDKMIGVTLTRKFSLN